MPCVNLHEVGAQITIFKENIMAQSIEQYLAGRTISSSFDNEYFIEILTRFNGNIEEYYHWKEEYFNPTIEDEEFDF